MQIHMKIGIYTYNAAIIKVLQRCPLTYRNEFHDGINDKSKPFQFFGLYLIFFNTVFKNPFAGNFPYVEQYHNSRSINMLYFLFIACSQCANNKIVYTYQEIFFFFTHVYTTSAKK